MFGYKPDGHGVEVELVSMWTPRRFADGEPAELSSVPCLSELKRLALSTWVFG